MDMVHVIDFFKGTGQIQSITTCTDSVSQIQSLLPACQRITVDASDTQPEIKKCYVANNALLWKTGMPVTVNVLQIAADGIGECVIGNIPSGASVTWPDGQTDEVTDGEVRFSVDLPGTYTLVFEAVEYLRKEVTIEALAPTES